MSLLGSIISGGLGIAGSVWGTKQQQNSAQAAMDFQKEVLQHRNQWMVEDLKKAGLNPILAAGATSGASAPGATAQADNPAAAGINSASQANAMRIAQREQSNRDKLAQSEIALNSALAVKAEKEGDELSARTGLHESTTLLNIASAGSVNEQTAKYRQETENLKQQLSNLKAQYNSILQDIRTSASIEQRNAAESRLKVIEAQGQRLINEGVELDNVAKALGLPKKETFGSFWGSVVGPATDAGSIFKRGYQEVKKWWDSDHWGKYEKYRKEKFGR